MNAIAKKCLWLVEEIIRTDGPRTSGDIARTTGISRDVIDDCCYALVQGGRVRCRSDSKLAWVEKAEAHIARGELLICPQSGRADHCPGDHNYPCNCVCHGPGGWTGGGGW